MARIRSIYPSFKHDTKVKRLSRDARLTFLLMLPEADDEGRMPGSGKWLAGTLYEDDDDVTVPKVTRWVGELAQEGLVRAYEVDGARFLHIVNFKRYQHPKKPSPSRLPAPPSTPPSGEVSTPPTTPPSGEEVHPPEVGGRKLEVGVRSSSSASGEPATPPEDEEEEDEEDDDPEIEAEVERRLAGSRRSGTEIVSVRAWKAKTRADVKAEVAENGRGVLAPPKSPATHGDDLVAAQAANFEHAERQRAMAPEDPPWANDPERQAENKARLAAIRAGAVKHAP